MVLTLRGVHKRFSSGEHLPLDTRPVGPFKVRTFVLKSGLGPKSGLFKKTDFPPSLPVTSATFFFYQNKKCRTLIFYILYIVA